MMDSPSLAMATGLTNWPGPSPWEPQVSTYSKAGGGGGAAAVCAGREQPTASAAAKSKVVRTRLSLTGLHDIAGKMPALRAVRLTVEITITISGNTSASRPLRA